MNGNFSREVNVKKTPAVCSTNTFLKCMALLALKTTQIFALAGACVSSSRVLHYLGNDRLVSFEVSPNMDLSKPEMPRAKTKASKLYSIFSRALTIDLKSKALAEVGFFFSFSGQQSLQFFFEMILPKFSLKETAKGNDGRWMKINDTRTTKSLVSTLYVSSIDYKNRSFQSCNKNELNFENALALLQFLLHFNAASLINLIVVNILYWKKYTYVYVLL